MVMKLKHFVILFLVFFSAELSTFFVYSENTAIEDILEAPQNFNTQEIEVVGEVVGEFLKDDEGVWINITSGSQQIGIFSDHKKVIEAITYWGEYRYSGDLVKVKGIFYKECPSHQISDLHLKTLEIIRKGHKNEFLISPKKKQLAIILSIICLMTAGLYFIKVKYGK